MLYDELGVGELHDRLGEQDGLGERVGVPVKEKVRLLGL